MFEYLPKTYDTDLRRYQVSRCGKFRSVSKKTGKTRLLSSFKHNGYMVVGLGGIPYLVHVLIATVFVPKPENYDSTFTVDHIDNNKLNNHVSNLRWASKPEQIKNRRENSRTKIDSMPVIATKKSDDSVLFFDSVYDVERIGANPGHVSSCINGKRKSHKGYTWSTPPSDPELPGEKFEVKGTNRMYTMSVSQYGRIKYAFKCEYAKIVSSFDKITEREHEECDSYPTITINEETRQLHNVVWETFIGRIPPGMVVHHKDHDKRNADLSNLELVTQPENMYEAHDAGRYDNTKTARVSVEIDGKTYESMNDASKKLGINVGLISYRVNSPNFPTYIRK